MVEIREEKLIDFAPVCQKLRGERDKYKRQRDALAKWLRDMAGYFFSHKVGMEALNDVFAEIDTEQSLPQPTERERHLQRVQAQYPQDSVRDAVVWLLRQAGKEKT